jgi:hypothetical protein
MPRPGGAVFKPLPLRDAVQARISWVPRVWQRLESHAPFAPLGPRQVRLPSTARFQLQIPHQTRAGLLVRPLFVAGSQYSALRNRWACPSRKEN